MPVTVTIDEPSLMRWIDRFSEELHVSVNKLVRYEMRLALRDCIRWTGPATLAAGRAKVKRDFSRASVPLNSEVLSGGFARTVKKHKESLDAVEQETLFTFYLLRANDLIKARDYDGMNAMLRKMPSALSRWTVLPFSERTFTDAMRGGRGGVKSQKVFVFDAQKWREQLARVQAHVGRLKAGWLPAYYAAGGEKVAGWIDRHFPGARGNYELPDVHAQEQIAVATNYALGVDKTAAIARRAMHIRAEAARKDFFLFQHGHKDVSSIE